MPDFIKTAWYDESPASDAIVTQVRDWLRNYSHEVQQRGLTEDERKRQMQAVNPKFIFRNYLAQEVIDDIEQGDTARLERLLNTLKKPYDEQPENAEFAQKRPEWARHRAGCSMLSCSS